MSTCVLVVVVETVGERERRFGEGKWRASPKSGHAAAQCRQTGEGGTGALRHGGGEQEAAQDY